jgi:hypothetical protein
MYIQQAGDFSTLGTDSYLKTGVRIFLSTALFLNYFFLPRLFFYCGRQFDRGGYWRDWGCNQGGGVCDFHPLQLDRVGCFKVKGEANGRALKVCASKKVLASWALGFSCRWESPTLGEEDSNLLDTRETELGFAESGSLMHHFNLNST